MDINRDDAGRAEADPLQDDFDKVDRELRIGLPAAGLREYAIFSLDRDGRVNAWNAAAERVKGYRANEIIGRPVSTFYPPEQVARGYPDWELQQASEQGFWVDQGWRVRRDGTRFWAHVVITAQRSPEGDLRGFVKVTRDVTEARARQRRSDQRFTDLFDLTPAGIGLVDDSGHLVDVNDALCDLTCYPRQDLLHLRAVELLDPGDRQAPLISPVGAPGRNPPARHAQRVLKRADGERLVCDIHSRASVHDDGSVFWLLVFQDVTEQLTHIDMLQHQATHDELTGLLNRKGFQELVEELLRSGRPVAVVFCDIDNFKRVNDTLGHHAGDEMLVSLARRLRGALPAGCTPARLYSDEFLIVCSDIEAVEGLETFTSWVSDLLRGAVPVGERLVSVSASVGGTTVESATTTGADLLQFADAAMLQAKARGPGRAVVASPTLIHATRQQLDLEAELREAITHDGLVLHYQPIVTGTGSVVLAEALVRWPHPTSGLLAPDVILPVATKAGLLGELDRWVLRTALAEAATWPTPAGSPVGVTVNLGEFSPDQPDFVDDVIKIIDASHIDDHRVVLEVTETSLAGQSDGSRLAMEKLARRGVRFAVDDFGTGYSSLGRLKDLPAQLIKLDRGFVAGSADNAGDLAICRSVVDLATAMGRGCIAEGVETASQFRLLTELGFHQHQGFLFSHPVPAHELRAMLETGTLTIPLD